MPILKEFDRKDDRYTETFKTTTGFFDGGLGQLGGNSLTTASLADGQKEYYLNLNDLLPILNDRTGFHRVELNDIAWKGFDLDMSLRADNCVCCNGNRFRDCNPTMPGILLEGIENPGGRKYRCLDGKHRIEALLSYEQTIGTFYILNMDHIEYYLKEYNE